jgi:predicted DNA-binding transcriptional regulator AlpA
LKIKLDKFGRRRHPAACKSRPKHISPPDLLCNPELAGEMCEPARSAATLAIAAALTGLAGAGLADEPEVSLEGDRLLTIDDAVFKTGLSKDQLYRRRDLPFRVNAGPGTVRFSEVGIERWIRAKTRPAA